MYPNTFVLLFYNKNYMLIFKVIVFYYLLVTGILTDIKGTI